MSKNEASRSGPPPFARQRRSEVEAEAVHVHLEHPVAQAVRNHAQHRRMLHVERVAAARVITVVAEVPGFEAIIGGIVDAAPRKSRAELIALAGVVVNHVKDDLKPAACSALTMRLNSTTCPPTDSAAL